MGIVFTSAGEYGSGVSVFDWDKDGYDDVVFLKQGASPAFYHNSQDGFESVNFSLPVFNEPKSLTWIDFDNDGDYDIFVNAVNESNRLFRNLGNMSFVDITTGSNLALTTGEGFTTSWADVNNDGFIDVYIGNYDSVEFGPNISNFLFLNNAGSGTFTNATTTWQCGNGFRPTLGTAFIDYDRDGDPDLFVANDRNNHNNFLYRNDGNLFVDVSAEAGVDTAIFSMTCTPGDVNNDGWLDIYITNNQNGNILHVNNGDGTFSQVASNWGCEVDQICWGATFLDFNNDLREDLVVCSEPFSGWYSRISGLYFLRIVKWPSTHPPRFRRRTRVLRAILIMTGDPIWPSSISPLISARFG
jgi:hypothetical protein